MTRLLEQERLADALRQSLADAQWCCQTLASNLEYTKLTSDALTGLVFVDFERHVFAQRTDGGSLAAASWSRKNQDALQHVKDQSLLHRSGENMRTRYLLVAPPLHASCSQVWTSCIFFLCMHSDATSFGAYLSDHRASVVIHGMVRSAHAVHDLYSLALVSAISNSGTKLSTARSLPLALEDDDAVSFTAGFAEPLVFAVLPLTSGLLFDI